MAYTFNHFFAVVGKSTNSKIESLAKENKFDLNNSIFTSRSFPTSEQFLFHSVKCKEVRDIINAMPSNKAPGIDKVPTQVRLPAHHTPFCYINHQCFSFIFNIPRDLETS